MLVVAEHEHLPVQQARAGEPEAWNALFRRYQLPLYVYVFELARDEQSSLDIVQETFIAAARTDLGRTARESPAPHGGIRRGSGGGSARRAGTPE